MFLMMAFSFVTYHIMFDQQSGFFERFGYPTYIVYPLAYLKLLALIVIATNRFNNLKEIAYGAFFLNTIMATTAHLIDGHHPWHAYILLICIPVSYLLSNKVRGRPARDFVNIWQNDPGPPTIRARERIQFERVAVKC